MAERFLLAAALLIVAGCRRTVPDTEPRNENFRAVAFPGGDFQARHLDGKLILQFANQPAAGWARAQNIIRDDGPDWASYRDADLRRNSWPSPPFPIEGRAYATRGSQWLRFLYSTDGAYLAIFSYQAHSPQPEPRSMPIGSVELIGHLFADVFRRADGVRVATMAERVWRRGGGGGQSWISFPSFGGAPLFIDDPVQAWADAAAWFAHRTLIVPAHETLEIAELAPAPTMPLPYDENSGLSIASGEPPEFAVHGLREEVVRRDGAIEALIVHLTVESEVAGKYQITAQFEGRAPIIEEHALPFGRQELTFGYDRQDFATAPGPLRLISVRTQFAARRKGVEARTTSTSLETGAYPRNLWSALPSRPFRLLSNGAVVRRTGTNFEVDLTIFALHSCDGGLDSVLSFSMGYLIGGVKLHPGYNRVTLHTQPLKIQQLHGPPHTIAFSEVRCGEHTFDLTEALTLPTLDFRGIPGARCSADYNGDGRVDDADLPLAIAEAHQQFTVLARTRTYEWVTEEGMRRNAEYYNQQNRGCRTK